MLISDWSSDVCSSDLARCARPSSGASRHLLPQAGEGLAIGLPRAGEGCSGGSARPSRVGEKARGRSHPYTTPNPTVEGPRFTAPPFPPPQTQRTISPTTPPAAPATTPPRPAYTS